MALSFEDSLEGVAEVSDGSGHLCSSQLDVRNKSSLQVVLATIDALGKEHQVAGTVNLDKVVNNISLSDKFNVIHGSLERCAQSNTFVVKQSQLYGIGSSLQLSKLSIKGFQLVCHFSFNGSCRIEVIEVIYKRLTHCFKLLLCAEIHLGHLNLSATVSFEDLHHKIVIRLCNALVEVEHCRIEVLHGQILLTDVFTLVKFHPTSIVGSCINCGSEVGTIDRPSLPVTALVGFCVVARDELVEVGLQ